MAHDLPGPASKWGKIISDIILLLLRWSNDGNCHRKRESLPLSMGRRLTQMSQSSTCLVVLLICYSLIRKPPGWVLCSGAPAATHWFSLALGTGDKDLVALVSEHASDMSLPVKLVGAKTIVHHHYSVYHILHLIALREFFKIHIYFETIFLWYL